MGEKKQKNNITNIFYGVIGIATLMLAVIGATFAYYTATASNNIITGNMATIDFDLSVVKVTNADNANGMIPMSNNMMEAALQSSKGTCVDDNGNAVCQVYKITVSNTSSASMFLDGYVTLTGGSGAPADVTTWTNIDTDGEDDQTGTSDDVVPTTMRWAQAFCSEESDGLVVTQKCTTAGSSTTRTTNTVSIGALGTSDTAKASGLDTAEIKTAMTDVAADYDINGSNYKVINSNYIRISDHTIGSTAYSRTTDITSALVYSQYLNADDKNANNNTGTSASTFTDSQVYYIVVWLSENGHNQTAGSTGTGVTATNFYRGNVTFISAQGSEVTAAFAGSVRVTPNTTT